MGDGDVGGGGSLLGPHPLAEQFEEPISEAGHAPDASITDIFPLGDDQVAGAQGRRHEHVPRSRDPCGRRRTWSTSSKPRGWQGVTLGQPEVRSAGADLGAVLPGAGDEPRK